MRMHVTHLQCWAHRMSYHRDSVTRPCKLNPSPNIQSSLIQSSAFWLIPGCKSVNKYIDGHYSFRCIDLAFFFFFIPNCMDIVTFRDWIILATTNSHWVLTKESTVLSELAHTGKFDCFSYFNTEMKNTVFHTLNMETDIRVQIYQNSLFHFAIKRLYL